MMSTRNTFTPEGIISGSYPLGYYTIGYTIQSFLEEEEVTIKPCLEI